MSSSTRPSDMWLSLSIDESYHSIPSKDYDHTDPEVAELESLSANLANKLERINDNISDIKRKKDKAQHKIERLEDENHFLSKENEELSEEIKQLERTLYLWQHQEQLKSPKHRFGQSSQFNRASIQLSTSILNNSSSMISEEDPDDDLSTVESIKQQIIEMKNTFQDQAIVLYQLQDFINETYEDRIEFQKIVLEVENDKKKASQLIEDYYVKKATNFECMRSEGSSLFAGSLARSSIEEDMTFGMQLKQNSFKNVNILPELPKKKKNMFCEYINSKRKKKIIKNDALSTPQIVPNRNN
ncbi:unnamed protein product [Blepharisma stoltei]|uniref:Uncharacterized protein n=1 Tax=Blepharisma stoltei TaxID=1481888 RepID=A0AAU9JXL8_9CILI|nr:unnamed protein product [Blepharisma stoltei]